MNAKVRPHSSFLLRGETNGCPSRVFTQVQHANAAGVRGVPAKSL